MKSPSPNSDRPPRLFRLFFLLFFAPPPRPLLFCSISRRRAARAVATAAMWPASAADMGGDASRAEGGAFEVWFGFESVAAAFVAPLAMPPPPGASWAGSFVCEASARCAAAATRCGAAKAGFSLAESAAPAAPDAPLASAAPAPALP